MASYDIWVENSFVTDSIHMQLYKRLVLLISDKLREDITHFDIFVIRLRRSSEYSFSSQNMGDSRLVFSACASSMKYFVIPVSAF